MSETAISPDREEIIIPSRSKLDRNETQETLQQLFEVFYTGNKGERLPTGTETWLYSTKDARVVHVPNRVISPEGMPNTEINIKAHTKRVAGDKTPKKHYDLQVKWGEEEPWRTYTFMLDGEYRQSEVNGRSELLPLAGNNIVMLNGLYRVSENDHAIALFLEFHPKNMNSPVYWSEDEQENPFGIRLKLTSRDKGIDTYFRRPVVAVQEVQDLHASVQRMSVSRALNGVADIGTLRKACEKFKLKIPAEASGQAHYMLGIVNDYAHDHPAEVLNFLFGETGDIMRMVELALARKIIEVQKNGEVITHTGKVWAWTKVPTTAANHAAYIAKQVVDQGEYNLFTSLKRQLSKWGQSGETLHDTINLVDGLIGDERIVKGKRFKWENKEGEKIVGFRPGSTDVECLEVLYKYADENPQEFRKVVGMGAEQ